MDSMNDLTDIGKAADRFSAVARRFCAVVDSASGFEKKELLSQFYRILPKLIDEAIHLPDVELSDNDEQIKKNTNGASRRKARQGEQEWGQLYNLLKEKLGDWDSYWQVFDPTEDTEAIFGSLADDLADIYRDVKEGIVLRETGEVPVENIVWTWRLTFGYHWGNHAMDALRTIHFRLENSAMAEE